MSVLPYRVNMEEIVLMNSMLIFAFALMESRVNMKGINLYIDGTLKKTTQLFLIRIGLWSMNSHVICSMIGFMKKLCNHFASNNGFFLFEYNLSLKRVQSIV